MVKQSQITEHSCIQGWTAIAQWTGVPLVEILSRCEPLLGAKYVVFHSFQYDQDGFEYYEVFDIRLAKHPQTILAYEMNGKILEIPHCAPLRLRVETQLGYKMVKWLNSIELVSDYSKIGRGQGGYREDVMFYGIGAGIWVSWEIAGKGKKRIRYSLYSYIHTAEEDFVWTIVKCCNASFDVWKLTGKQSRLRSQHFSSSNFILLIQIWLVLFNYYSKVVILSFHPPHTSQSQFLAP